MGKGATIKHFYHEQHGNPKGPLLVLLHGFMGNSQDWNGLIATLREDYFCVTVDLPGHGRSVHWGHHTTWDFPTVGRALVATIGPFLHTRQKFLLGYSMGGRLALYLAIHHPGLFDGVVLASASPGLATAAQRTARTRQDEQLAQRLESQNFPRFLYDWYQIPLFQSLRRHSAFDDVLARRRQNHPPALAKALREMGTGHQPSLWHKLSEMNFPLHLVIGEKDAKFGAIAAEMKRYNPRITCSVIPGSGHSPHLEAPAAFATCIREVLNNWNR